MKFCVDCAYHEYRQCCAPENGYNLVTGKSNKIPCIVARRFNTPERTCGRDGRYFKEIEKNRKDQLCLQA